MKITWISGITLVLALILATPAAAGCQSTSGCKHCVWIPELSCLTCGTVEIDGYCSCEPMAGGGCDMGTEICDYTGSGGAPCNYHGTCPDQQYRSAEENPITGQPSAASEPNRQFSTNAGWENIGDESPPEESREGRTDSDPERPVE